MAKQTFLNPAPNAVVVGETNLLVPDSSLVVKDGPIEIIGTNSNLKLGYKTTTETHHITSSKNLVLNASGNATTKSAFYFRASHYDNIYAYNNLMIIREDGRVDIGKDVCPDVAGTASTLTTAETAKTVAVKMQVSNGDIFVKRAGTDSSGIVLESPSGKKFRITVDDNGNIDIQ